MKSEQTQIQLDALEAFWGEWFKLEKGEFKPAFQNFPSREPRTVREPRAVGPVMRSLGACVHNGRHSSAGP